jgi:transcriptional regulator with XRE-family HTH domain
MTKTNDAVKITHRRYLKNHPERQEQLREISLNAEVAEQIYGARKQAGLTQQQLADLIGTKQSVIARLEDADYEGHSLSMLQRIAEVLGQKIEIKMVPMVPSVAEEEPTRKSIWIYTVLPLIEVAKDNHSINSFCNTFVSEYQSIFSHSNYQLDPTMSTEYLTSYK